MKKILIIGNAGYIGSRLERHLDDLHDVAGVDTEWFGAGSAKTIVKDYRNLPADVVKAADVIILLAGHSGVKMCDNEIQHSWRNNVSNFVDLVGKMRRDQQLIYASSGSVYGNANSSVFQPVNNYDITKYVLDLEAQRFINDGYKILGLRFGTVNGFSTNLRSELMINAMVNNAVNQGKITVNNKYVRRPILALSDVCGAMEAMIDVPAPRSGIYDLCSFNDRVIDIAEDVCHYMDVELQETPDRAGVYDFVINNERFSREFDYRFTATRQDVIGEVAANLNLCRKGDRNTPKEYQ
jgi:nucleoside-diphosphate-sugar epimerase